MWLSADCAGMQAKYCGIQIVYRSRMSYWKDGFRVQNEERAALAETIQPMSSTRVQFQVRRSRDDWRDGNDENSPRVGEWFSDR